MVGGAVTTYYIDPVNGSNSNNGLGPDASHATNKPYATIGKILATSGVGAAGDVVYLAPGVYREAITINITSPASELQILGDPANAQGFKTSGGVLVDPGYVRWTAYTTNDTTAPGTAALTLNGRDNLTFQDIVIVGGSAGAVIGTTTTSQAITFRRCVFPPGSSMTTRQIQATTAADTALNWTIDSCVFTGCAASGSAILITAPAGSSADYDLNFSIKNSLFINSQSSFIQLSGAASNKPGGVAIRNCTFIGDLAFRVATGGSTSIPCTFYNCYILAGNGGLQATATGEILEDYNIILAGTPRTSVTAGSNSTSDGSRSNLLEIGQTWLYGFAPRPLFSPMASSPLLGFGNTGSPPSVDFLNRPRPAGGASTSNAVGAFERHDTAAKETSTVRTGSNALVLTGPADHDFQVPVDATSTTLSVYARYDSNHAATNKPQMKVLNGSECGVSDATATMTSAADTWEQLSLTFTPTRAGIVTIRLISRAAAGNGKAFFDDFAKT